MAEKLNVGKQGLHACVQTPVYCNMSKSCVAQLMLAPKAYYADNASGCFHDGMTILP